MSVAVLLSGRITTSDYGETIKRLKCTLSGYDVVYFISVNSKVHDSDYTRRFIKDMNVSDCGRIGCVNVEETLCNSDYTKYTKRKETDYERVYSMYYHNKQCFKMMEEFTRKNKMTFDVVLKYRTDIDNETSLMFDELAEGTVYIPYGYDFGGINDNIAYGDVDSMRIYVRCVDNIASLCEEGVIFHPETLLQAHLQRIGLKVERFNFTYKLVSRSSLAVT